MSKAVNTQSTGSISAQTSDASVSSSSLNESASAILSANISSLAALRTNSSLLSNGSLTDSEYYERGPVDFSSNTIIGTGGKYRVWLDLSLAALIVAAYHTSPWPKSDGEIPGDLPLCGGSPFVSYCAESVALAADNDADLAGRWSLTNTRNPRVPAQQAETLARIQRFYTARGVFVDETEQQQTSLLDGIFAGCENIDRVGPGLPVESYASFLGGLNDPLCTVASTPTATTTSCPTMTVTYPGATAPPYTTLANVPAGDPRCRTYNPNVNFQASGLCDAGLEWEGCQADASSWLGYYNELTGPFASPQGPGAFAAVMEGLQAPNWVWNVTLMGKPYCSAANALVEAPIISVGTTTASCQALPTSVQFGAVSINDLGEGFCAKFNYASDCSGGMQTFCNRGSVPTSTCLPAVAPGNRYPQNYKGFEIVPA